MKVILPESGQEVTLSDDYDIAGASDVDDELGKALGLVFRYLTPERTGASHKLTIELGPTLFSPDDFVPRKSVVVNGCRYGAISLEKYMDLRAMGK